MVGIEQSHAFPLSIIDLTLQSRELGLQELIVGGRLPVHHCMFARSEQRRGEHGLSNLAKHERVQLVCTDLALATTTLLTTSLEDVVILTSVVVVVPARAPAGRGSHAGAAYAARAAHDKPSQQPPVHGNPS